VGAARLLGKESQNLQQPKKVVDRCQLLTTDGALMRPAPHTHHTTYVVQSPINPLTPLPGP